MLNVQSITDVTTRVQDRANKVLHEVRAFVFKQNILALAIGVIIGTATNNMVQAMIADVVMPMVNRMIPDQSWTTAGYKIGEYKDVRPHLDAAGKPVVVNGKPVMDTVWVDNKILYGHLLWQLLNLLVMCAVAYVFSVYLFRPPPAGPPTRTCPHCLEQVPEAAKVCKFCTRELPPVALAPTASGAAT